MLKLIKFLVAQLISLAAGGIGSLATIPNIPTWYAALEKPFFNPPNWLFGPVWTLLYVLMGVSLYLVWVTPYKKSKQQAFVVFGVQLALNALWSLVFFGLHMPWAGVMVIVLLLAGIVATVKLFWPISKTAAYLLLPYVAWVSFATALNFAIALLN
jgi:tryptophan-rich sensory protein